MIQTSLIRAEIKRLRRQKGISPDEMAEMIGMEKRNYERIESGERKTLDIELADQIATALGANLTDWIRLASVSIKSIKDSVVGFPNRKVVIKTRGKDEIAAMQKIIEEQSGVIKAQAGIIEQQKQMIDMLMNQAK